MRLIYANVNNINPCYNIDYEIYGREMEMYGL